MLNFYQSTFFMYFSFLIAATAGMSFINLFIKIEKFLGIHPRHLGVSTPLSFFTAWALHLNLNHFFKNIGFLLALAACFYPLTETPFSTTVYLILASSFWTWLLGSPNSYHIGASGLIYAFFGFVVIKLFLYASFGHYAFYIWCLLIVVIFGYSLFLGLIPKESVSFTGHWGGLFSGAFIATLY